MSRATSLTAELGRILGVGHCSKAVLTLEGGKAPTLQVTMPLATGELANQLQQLPAVDPDTMLRRLAAVQFMLRLEPFQDVGAE